MRVVRHSPVGDYPEKATVLRHADGKTVLVVKNKALLADDPALTAFEVVAASDVERGLLRNAWFHMKGL